MGSMYVVGVIALLAIIIIARTAVVVPQQSAYVVERLGKFSGVLDAGGGAPCAPGSTSALEHPAEPDDGDREERRRERGEHGDLRQDAADPRAERR